MNEKIGRDLESGVRRGDKLRIPAQTFNKILEATKAYQREKYQEGAGTPAHTIYPNSTVLVFNDSSPSNIFDAVRIDKSLIDLNEDPFEALGRPGVIGVTVLDESDAIAIMKDTNETGEIASGVISGITPAYVWINDESHKWARPVPGQPYLESIECGGPARILDKYDNPESGYPPEVQLCLINLIGHTACNEEPVSGGSEGSGESGDSGDSGESGDSNPLCIDIVTKVCLNPESGIGLRIQYTRVCFPPGTTIGDTYCIDDEADCCTTSYPDGGEDCESATLSGENSGAFVGIIPGTVERWWVIDISVGGTYYFHWGESDFGAFTVAVYDGIDCGSKLDEFLTAGTSSDCGSFTVSAGERVWIAVQNVDTEAHGAAWALNLIPC